MLHYWYPDLRGGTCFCLTVNRSVLAELKIVTGFLWRFLICNLGYDDVMTPARLGI